MDSAEQVEPGGFLGTMEVWLRQCAIGEPVQALPQQMVGDPLAQGRDLRGAAPEQRAAEKQGGDEDQTGRARRADTFVAHDGGAVFGCPVACGRLCIGGTSYRRVSETKSAKIARTTSVMSHIQDRKKKQAGARAGNHQTHRGPALVVGGAPERSADANGRGGGAG